MKIIEQPPKHDIRWMFAQENLWQHLGDEDIEEFLRHANDAYLHWDKLRRRPAPQSVSREALWTYLRYGRRSSARPIALRDTENKAFSFWLPECAQKILSHLDRGAGDIISSDEPGRLPRGERYIISSLMEEAIASSQLEGAHTERSVAKEMLRTGRKPLDHSEKMIANNWLAMQHLRANLQQPLSLDFLCEIHSLVTQGTLDNAEDEGRFRDRDDVVVEYRGEDVHIPPSADNLEKRLQDLCDFANNEEGQWIHPIVKASILHFAIGYEHPFVDGNGRTARAIFYWYLLSSGYWLFEYLPVSRFFLRARVPYMKAYLYTENDEGDLTYFIVYCLRIVQLAADDMRRYLANKQRELSDANRSLRQLSAFNERQRELLNHALRHPDAEYTIESHRSVHNVSYLTARSDLSKLEEKEFLHREKRGKTFIFTPISQTFAAL